MENKKGEVMKKHYAISIISLITSVVTLTLVLLNLHKIVDEGKIRSMVNEPIAKVEESIAESVAEIKGDIEKIKKRAMPLPFTGMIQYSRVDVSDIADTGEKVKRILKEFEGVNFYTSNNVLVDQIVEMGDDAIQPLLAQMDEQGYYGKHGQWAKKSAMEDALNRLLTENHKEIILKIFKEKDVCSKLIKRYKFPEAEDMVMDKIKYNRRGRVNHDVIDAALMMNEKRAIPLLINYMASGFVDVYAAQKLAAIPELDITELLRKAAKNARGVWSQSGMAKLLIERGMKEGFELAIQVLRSTEEHSEYKKQQISATLITYTDAKGNYNEMANWLEKNKDSLVWNKEYRRFK